MVKGWSAPFTGGLAGVRSRIAIAGTAAAPNRVAIATATRVGQSATRFHPLKPPLRPASSMTSRPHALLVPAVIHLGYVCQREERDFPGNTGTHNFLREIGTGVVVSPYRQPLSTSPCRAAPLDHRCSGTTLTPTTSHRHPGPTSSGPHCQPHAPG
jgi:hypothetical protein